MTATCLLLSACSQGAGSGTTGGAPTGGSQTADAGRIYVVRQTEALRSSGGPSGVSLYRQGAEPQFLRTDANLYVHSADRTSIVFLCGLNFNDAWAGTLHHFYQGNDFTRADVYVGEESIGISADGSTAFFCTEELPGKDIYLFRNGKEEKIDHTDETFAGCLSGNGKYFLYTVEKDGLFRLMLYDGSESREIAAEADSLVPLFVSDDGARLYYGLADIFAQEMPVFYLEKGKQAQLFKDVNTVFAYCFLNEDGSEFVYHDGTKLNFVKNGELRWEMPSSEPCQLYGPEGIPVFFNNNMLGRPAVYQTETLADLIFYSSDGHIFFFPDNGNVDTVTLTTERMYPGRIWLRNDGKDLYYHTAAGVFRIRDYREASYRPADATVMPDVPECILGKAVDSFGVSADGEALCYSQGLKLYYLDLQTGKESLLTEKTLLGSNRALSDVGYKYRFFGDTKRVFFFEEEQCYVSDGGAAPEPVEGVTGKCDSVNYTADGVLNILTDKGNYFSTDGETFVLVTAEAK